MQENSQIDKKTFSEHSDLYPKLGQDEFPGKQSKTTGNATGIIVQLLENFIPHAHIPYEGLVYQENSCLEILNLHREFSIHHIFPQTRFKNNHKFTTSTKLFN